MENSTVAGIIETWGAPGLQNSRPNTPVNQQAQKDSECQITHVGSIPTLAVSSISASTVVIFQITPGDIQACLNFAATSVTKRSIIDESISVSFISQHIMI